MKRILVIAGLAALFSCSNTLDKDLSVLVITDEAGGIGTVSATLNGSFFQASSDVREVGFRWGTAESSMTEVILADNPGGTTGKFRAQLESLKDDSTFYYKAYVILQNGDDVRTFYGETMSFSTLPEQEGQEYPPLDPESVSVTTGNATGVSSTSATLSGSYEGTISEIYDHGFVYGTSSSNLDKWAALNSTSGMSGSFTASLSSLEPGTVYYYKAYVTVWSREENKYVDFAGAVKQFTTTQGGSSSGNTGLQYLGCYEMPAIALSSDSGYSDSGTEKFGNTRWYNYNTTNQRQMVVTHTYSYNSKQYRNWTALVDADKKAPLWSAFVMHKNAYPDNNLGRTGSWTPDPGIPESWQSCFSSSGYSRGHFVASNYRQACSDANKQTFYYTNQALQFQNKFNDGVWNSLENAVVSNAPSGRDTLYVTVGILYEDNNTLSGVPCPSHFYKCLMKCSFDSSGNMTAAKGVAYLFKNEATTDSYSSHATTIDAVEQRSGWDFFANVPKDLQDAAEKMSSSLW